MSIRAIILLVSFVVPVLAFAQGPDGRTIRERYVDSIKQSTYPYVFPAWGKRVTKKGIDMPLPAGVMLNYITGSQLVNISDLQVGFNGGPLVPLDFVKFGEVKAHFQSVNTRFDLWALPFFNVYGIVGGTFASTNVNVTAPFNFSSKANFKGPMAGIGASLGGAMYGIFGVIDANSTWSFLDNIDGAINTRSYSGRFGHAINFKRRPDRNVTLWVGTTGNFIGRTTTGTIKFSDLNSSATKPDLQPIKDETAAWYQTLTPAQKIVTKQIAEKLLDKIDGLDLQNASISYSLIKRATSNWSMLFGGQFQLNHRWQFRTETGFLGGRKSLLTSVNYRFGL
ncbi:hypothetical protein [Mucilaginibacter agri]|uniref:Type IX secretion system membrane protein PorP/SprF n=1 Tax=Mucilaginibacter agri TaxID=2695265 RepID=A0A966DWC5_9SPHI|nr:hypothetical protein [Mucilaginibacter agri]NCD72367.1 hypothetical protein [Mucilaginibacter agri]